MCKSYSTIDLAISSFCVCVFVCVCVCVCVNFGEVCLFQDLIVVVLLVILMSNLVYNVRY